MEREEKKKENDRRKTFWAKCSVHKDKDSLVECKDTVAKAADPAGPR